MCQKQSVQVSLYLVIFIIQAKGNGKAMLIRLVRAAWKEGKSHGDGPCVFAWKGRPSRSQISCLDT